ncbi:MAG: AmmeMemoRadiSam system protein A [Bacteroidales bacterium]|nr:AmmeMemoRadiSam system protein A [Bacteroidales bacterium]
MQLAYAAAERHILHGIHHPEEPPAGSENLLKRCGAFVSVYIGGTLRGCIGTFSENEPIYVTVQEMAVAAVSQDSRFKQVESSELGDMELEISILTPRRAINDISEIKIGKHGIYIARGMNRGTFLPQVAVEQNWSPEEFISHCSRYKAGLGWDGWKHADKFVFESVVIRSTDFTDVSGQEKKRF